MLTNVLDAFCYRWTNTQLFFFLFNFVKLTIIVMIEKLSYLILFALFSNFVKLYLLPKIVLITLARLDL